MKGLLKALDTYKRKPMEAGMDDSENESAAEDAGENGEEPMEDPRSQNSDGTVLYLDKGMFPKGCKVGDKVKIIATVDSMGSKLGVIPEGVTPEHEEM